MKFVSKYLEPNLKSWFYRALLGPALIVDGVIHTLTYGYFHINCGLHVAFLMAQSRQKNEQKCTNPSVEEFIDNCSEDNYHNHERFRNDTPSRHWSRQKQEKWDKEYRAYWNLTEDDYVDEQDLLDYIGERYELVPMKPYEIPPYDGT
jgi:hypothetical protein